MVETLAEVEMELKVVVELAAGKKVVVEMELTEEVVKLEGRLVVVKLEERLMVVMAEEKRLLVVVMVLQPVEERRQLAEVMALQAAEVKVLQAAEVMVLLLEVKGRVVAATG